MFVRAAGLSLLVACGGGGDFGVGTTLDGGTSSTDGGTIVVGPSDPTSPPEDGAASASRLDASLGCRASELACGTSCVADDKANCGACGKACVDPPNGVGVCQGSGASRGCTLACNGGYTSCGGACLATADFANDPRNCGSCGHDCMAGSCSNGACQPWLIATADYVLCGGAYGRACLATDGTSVAWVDSSVSEAPVSGGPATPLADVSGDADFPTALAMSGSLVVYTNKLEVSVANGSARFAFRAWSGQLYGLTITGTDVYTIFSGQQQTNGPNVVNLVKGSIASADGTATVVGSAGLPFSYGRPDLVATANALFWSEPGTGKIGRATLPYANPSYVATGQQYPSLLAADASNIYWTTLNPGTSSSPPSFSVSRTSQAGGASVQAVYPSQSGVVRGLAVDASNLYVAWSSASTPPTGEIDYVPLDGSAAPRAVETFTSGPPIGMVAAKGALYWVSGVWPETITGLRFP